MKIIILGAGQVGATLAENLSKEDSDVTVVDINEARLRALQDRLDIRTVTGMGSHPAVLKQAGADDADMMIAVTSSDEVNMIACQVAFTVFRTPTKIARIRSGAYPETSLLFRNEAIPIDFRISPEQLVTDNITRLIEYPGALQVLDFADGLVQLVAVRAYYGGPLVGQELGFLREHMPSVDTRIAAIFRGDRPVIPTGNTVIEADDEVFFIAAKADIRDVMSELRRMEKPHKRIAIAGGGNIGERLARAIDNKFQVKIIERDLARCQDLSESLERAIVLHGDASDKELLLEEHIDECDVFCALTNDDEANIMSSMLAKRLGARTVMTLINNRAYVDLVQGGRDIDIAISPQQATIGALLTHIRRGDIVSVHSLRRGAAEAIEAIAHGDRKSSKVVDRTIEEIPLPKDTTIGAILRNGEVIIAHHDVRVQADDHIILFVIDKKRISEVEQLFQVGLSFF